MQIITPVLNIFLPYRLFRAKIQTVIIVPSGDVIIVEFWRENSILYDSCNYSSECSLGPDQITSF